MKKLLIQYRLVLVISLLLTGSQNILWAQSPYTRLADSLTQNISKKDVTTGILYDRVYPFARLDAFNRTQADTTGYYHFRQAYAEMYNAHLGTPTNMVAPDDWDAMVEYYQFNGELPLGVVDIAYNQLKSDAVSRNLLSYTNGLLYDVQGRTESPFEERRVRMAALLAESIKPGAVTLSWHKPLLPYNAGAAVTSVQLQFSNGMAPVTLSSGNPRQTVTFTQGTINITATVNYDNGTSFTSLSMLDVAAQAGVESDFTPVPACSSKTVVANIPFQGYEEAVPQLGQVEVNYYYRILPGDINACNPRKLSKPIIVLDGFDPTDKRDAAFIYGFNFEYFTQGGIKQNLALELRRQGYDIIILNFPKYVIGTRNIGLPDGQQELIGNILRSGGDYLERQAMSLIAVINNVNAELAGTNEKIVVVGPSQGGVISRYALRYMETHNMNHNCRVWFSWDATHLGSVLPMGQQYFMKALADMGLRGAKDGVDQQVNAPAAKQALRHHYLSGSVAPAGAPGFWNRFYNELDQLGFPQQTRKIAMISGAVNGTPQPSGVAGGTAFDFNLKVNDAPRILLFNLMGAISNPNIVTANLRFTPAQGQGNVKVLDMKFLGVPMASAWAGPSPVSNGSIELIQGGNYPGFKEIRDSTRFKMKGFMKFMVDPIFTNVIDVHNHQPSGNTLAMGKGPYVNPNRKWDDNFTATNFNCGAGKETPFDAWFAPGTNLRHDSLTWEYAWRMTDEINGIPMDQAKPWRNDVMTGATGYMCPGEERWFSLQSPEAGVNYTWNTTDPMVLEVVDGQGTANVKLRYNGGAATKIHITCGGENECYRYAVQGLTINNWGDETTGDYTSQGYYYPQLLLSGRSGGTYYSLVNGNTTTARVTQQYVNNVTYSLVTPVAGLVWSQSGNALQVYGDSRVYNQNVLANFRATATNSCGTTVKYFNLKFKKQDNSIAFRVTNLNNSGDMLSMNLEQSSNLEGNVNWTLIDMAGRVLANRQQDNMQRTLQFKLRQQLSKGVYLIRKQTESGIETTKIMID